MCFIRIRVFGYVQLGWTPIGQTRGVAPLAHGERVNVLAALRHDDTLHWKIQRRPTVREDVIGFAARPNAGFAVRTKRRRR